MQQSHSLRHMFPTLREEMEHDMLLLKLAQQHAENIVRDRGWSEDDADFYIQIEEETKQQWDELYERKYL